MKILALTLIVLFTTSTYSEESKHTFNIHLASYHFNDRTDGKEWNEKNLGLGVEYKLDNHSFIGAGFFENSYFVKSNYLSYSKKYGNKFKYGWFIGIADGYPEDVSPIYGYRPLAGLKFEYKNVDIIVNDTVITASLIFKYK